MAEKKLAEQIVNEIESYAAIPTVTVDQFRLPQNRVNYSGAEIRANTAGSSDADRANSALIRQLISEVRALRNDVKRIDPCVQIGDDKIYNSAVRGGKREALATRKAGIWDIMPVKLHSYSLNIDKIILI